MRAGQLLLAVALTLLTAGVGKATEGGNPVGVADGRSFTPGTTRISSDEVL